MISQEVYERNESLAFQRQLINQPIGTERRDNITTWRRAMSTCAELIAHRIGWLIQGAYGYGSHQATLRVLQSPRMNREAWLVQTIGALEWSVKADDTRAIWKTLTPAQKAKLSELVTAEIKDWESEQSEVQA